MAKYEQTKKKYNNNKKKDRKNSSKLTARQVKQIARAAEKKATKKKETEKRAKEVQRLQGKKERLKNLSQQQVKKAKLEDFFEVTETPKPIKTSDKILKEKNKVRRLLMDKIKKSDKKPSAVLNNYYYLKAYIYEIVEEHPELEETAFAELAKEKKKLESGIYRDERMITSLITEFRQSTIRTASSDNVPYKTGIGSDLNAGVYVEAIYRAFKDEVAAKGVDSKQFRRALDRYLKQEPHELYEEYITSNNKKARGRQLKSPKEIVEMAVGITLLHSYK